MNDEQAIFGTAPSSWFKNESKIDVIQMPEHTFLTNSFVHNPLFFDRVANAILNAKVASGDLKHAIKRWISHGRGTAG